MKYQLLTPREEQVVVLLCEGKSTEEIASLLFISNRTVRTHIEHIFTKLHLRNRIQIVAYGYKSGIAK